MLNEQQIKAAVVDHLFNKGLLTDAVLINEMVVANWSRRADLAVANGKLHAFEIKSDLDTLKRLKEQVSAYLTRFDKVTVITTSKFINSVIECVPQNVEVWHVSDESEEVSIRVARRGQAKEINNRCALSSFLLKSDLAVLLKKHGFDVSVDFPRTQLVKMLENISIKTLRTFVLAILKKRYAKSFNEFLCHRSIKTQSEDLKKLSRIKAISIAFEDAGRGSEIVQRQSRKLDLARFKSKYGIIPDDMPTYVLPRKCKTS